MEGKQTQTVLIADDSPLVLRLLENMLKEAGFGVALARDGLEAVEKAFRDEIDLVILDVMMPRMNGYQACRLLKSEPATQTLPVIILTSRDQAADRFWGLETGADYYLTKDSDPKRILALVNEALATATRRQAAGQMHKPGGSVDILSRVNDLLDRKLFEATILSEIGRVARSLERFDETVCSVMGLIARVVEYSLGAMAFLEKKDATIVLWPNRPVSSEFVDDAKAKILEALNLQPENAVGKHDFRSLPPNPSNAEQPEEGRLLNALSFPVMSGGRTAGLLWLGGKAVARLSPETESLLVQVANQAYMVTENSRLFDRVRNLSIRDSLTDLYNHRHAMERLANEFVRVSRYRESLSVLMADIDHFKTVNDIHGHQAGDLILREVARLLAGNLRTIDMVGRYGGEEFVVILPNTRHEEAVHTAERLRAIVERQVIRFGGKELNVTISIGVSTSPSAIHIDSPSALVREADKALYRAKAGGRNCVC